jgi:hypothetical protein
MKTNDQGRWIEWFIMSLVLFFHQLRSNLSATAQRVSPLNTGEGTNAVPAATVDSWHEMMKKELMPRTSKASNELVHGFSSSRDQWSLNSDEQQIHDPMMDHRILATSVGRTRALLVRITTLDSVCTYNGTQLWSNTFQGDGSLQAQLSACSNGQLQFLPALPMTLEVMVSRNASRTNRMDIVNAAYPLAVNQIRQIDSLLYGNLQKLEDFADFLMFVVVRWTMNDFDFVLYFWPFCCCQTESNKMITTDCLIALYVSLFVIICYT